MQQIQTPVIDRVNGPAIQPIKVSEFPEYEKIVLDNGLALYLLNAGTQEIFKFELMGHAGRRFERAPGIGRMTASIIKEGNKNKNSHQLSEYWDYYGAMVAAFSDLDIAGLSLTGLNKYAENLIPEWIEMMCSPSIEEKELIHYRRMYSDKLSRDLVKNDVLAYREFTTQIFGDDHHYGYNTQPGDYEKITREDVENHFRNYWGTNRFWGVISGKISDPLKELIIDQCGRLPIAKIDYAEQTQDPIIKFDLAPINISTENRLQAALKVGSRTIARTHEDYNALYLLVQILGGYFGSRLMKNLREEKGLCYNIYASIDRMKTANYLYISADVDANKVDESLAEIKNELSILKESLVDEEELSMVKSYISGRILAGLDGPFRSANLLKSYLSHELPFDYFCQFTKELEIIDAERLRQVANDYLKWDEMQVIVVGP